MSSWWNSASTSNFTRGITSITGQLSTNLKDILTEASEETYDPNAELTRTRQQIEDLELSKQTLIEEVSILLVFPIDFWQIVSSFSAHH